MQTQDKLDVQAVGVRAAEIFAGIQAHPLYERLTQSSLYYTDCWFTNTGYATVSQWDQAQDAPVLAIEGLKVLALKAAVFAATGDEKRAELLVPSPVDEMVHAILAQPNVLNPIAARVPARRRRRPRGPQPHPARLAGADRRGVAA